MIIYIKKYMLFIWSSYFTGLNLANLPYNILFLYKATFHKSLLQNIISIKLRKNSEVVTKDSESQHAVAALLYSCNLEWCSSVWTTAVDWTDWSELILAINNSGWIGDPHTAAYTNKHLFCARYPVSASHTSSH